MRVVDVESREVGDHGSAGASFTALTRGENIAVGVISLAAGGLLGRHPAVRRQLLVVMEGTATVSGADGISIEISAGQGALWEPGEPHETASADGMTAVIIEGDLFSLG